MSSTENQETDKKVIKINFDKNKKLQGFTTKAPMADLAKKLAMSNNLAGRFVPKNSFTTLAEKMAMPTNKWAALAKTNSMSEVAKKLAMPTQKFQDGLLGKHNKGIWASLQAAENLNKSTAKTLAQMMTLPKTDITNGFIDKGSNGALASIQAASLLDTNNALKTTLKPLTQAHSQDLADLFNTKVIPEFQTAIPKPISPPEIDTSWLDEHNEMMAQDKAREREAHEAMIEMKQIQVTSNETLGQMTKTQETQAQFTQILVELQKETREDQKQSNKDNRKLNRKVLLFTILAVIIGAIGSGITVIQYVESKQEKRTERMLEKFDELKKEIQVLRAKEKTKTIKTKAAIQKPKKVATKAKKTKKALKK